MMARDVTEEELAYRSELAQRSPAAAMATIGEVWDAEWRRAGIDTFFGQSQYLGRAHDKLTEAIEGASGRRISDLAREHNIRFDGSVDGRLSALVRIADTLPPEARKEIEPLLDVRGQAAAAAQKVEKDADEVAARTYGLSGVATGFAAGMARQMVDPVALFANVATAPLGGPFKGPLLPVLMRQAAAGMAAQAIVEPFIQSGRAELGLESGWVRGATNVLEAGVGAATLTGLLRGGAFALRGARNLMFGEPPPIVAPTGVREGDILRARVASMLAPEDLEAAARFTERNQFLEMQTPPPMQPDRFNQNLERAGGALNDNRPIDRAAAAMGGWLEADSPAPGSGNRAQARSAQFDPNRFAPTDDAERMFVIRPNGGRLPVTERVVELKDIIASHNLDGRVNPSYPAELQPRDRSAPASRTFVAEKAAQLEPEMLGRSPTAAEGAPVIGPDGVVESGNGRVMMIATAYDKHPERAQAYRDFLTREGHNIEGMEFPVLVRVREGELSAAERAVFTREANVATVANLSPRERAFSDAKSIDDNLLATFRGGQIASAENAPFVRAFADRVVAPEERPQFIGTNDQLSFDGARRIEAALVAKAWGKPEIVSALYETVDPTSRAILGAFADTAPLVARLKAAIEAGRIEAKIDPTPPMLDAYTLVDRARTSGQKVADLVDQIDLEHGAVPEGTREAVRLYFRDDGLRVAAGRDAVAARLEQAINRALDTQNAVGDLFGAEFDKAGTLRAAKLAGQELEDQALGVPGAPEHEPQFLSKPEPAKPPEPAKAPEPAKPETIIGAAVRVGDEVFSGPTHAAAAAKAADKGHDISKLNLDDIDGFATSEGRYVSRQEAARIATAAEQTSKPGAEKLESSTVDFKKGQLEIITRDEAIARHPEIPPERIAAPYYVVGKGENKTFMSAGSLAEAQQMMEPRRAPEPAPAAAAPDPLARKPNETDKDFAKRVIDKRPKPTKEELPEVHSLYFRMDEETKIVPIEKIVSSKTEKKNAQGGENAVKRMAATANGELSGRGPISVTRLQNSRDEFMVIDGNGTYTSVRPYGWKELPVKIEPGLFNGTEPGVTKKPANPSEEWDAKRKALAYGQPNRTLAGLIENSQTRQPELIAGLREATAQAPSAVVENPGPKVKRPPPAGDPEHEKGTAKFNKRLVDVDNKITRKDYADVRELTDLVRAGVTIETPEEGDVIVASLARRFRVIDEGWKVYKGNYFDRKIEVILPDGTMTEVQLWPPSVFTAKKFAEEAPWDYHFTRDLSPEEQAKSAATAAAFWNDTLAALDPDVWGKTLTDAGWTGPRQVEAGAGGGSPNKSKVSSYPERAASSDISLPSDQTSMGRTGDQAPVRADATKAAVGDTTASRPSHSNQVQELRGRSKTTEGSSTDNIGLLGPDRKPLPPALVNAAEQALEAIGDFEISLPGPEGTVIKMPARTALAEAREDAIAAAEFAACAGGGAE